MKTFLKQLLVLLTLFSLEHAWAQPPGLDSTVDMLTAKENRMVEYSRDFLDIAGGLGYDNEDSPRAIELSDIAGSTSDYARVVNLLLNIYHHISHRHDRNSIKPEIVGEVKYYVRKIDLSVTRVNHLLTVSHQTGITDTGVQFKNELREVISILDRIDLR